MYSVLYFASNVMFIGICLSVVLNRPDIYLSYQEYLKAVHDKVNWTGCWARMGEKYNTSKPTVALSKPTNEWLIHNFRQKIVVCF